MTVVQVQILRRASDPIFEVAMALGGHRKEDAFWEHTLKALVNHFAAKPEYFQTAVCVDKKRQWKRAKNI